MINLENVSFSYRKGRPLFDDLSLRMSAGHICGLLGKNGAGKTTLLRLMTGLNFAQSGTVTTLDENAALRKPEMLKDIYFLTEEMPVSMFTARKYAKYYAPFYENFSFEQYEEYLHLFEVPSMDDKIHRLSLGQKKKVFISFALATNTRILLMDEPTNGLDIPAKATFRRLLSMAANDERLILISTHQVRDLHSLIDSIVIVEDGQVLLNADNERITRKLCFKVREDITDEPILYCEETLRGDLLVCENIYNVESKLDIELLFNAVMHNKKRIAEIFNH